MARFHVARLPERSSDDLEARIIARGQLRPDRCDREVTTPVSDEAADYLAEVPIGDALVVQDYGKGVCTDQLLKKVVERAHGAGVPILIDPGRGRDWSDYGPVTLIKANWAEATEQVRTGNIAPLKLARQLSRKHRCHVVITLGERGLVCAERNGQAWYLPAKRVLARDVCGAGDTVLATIAVGLARGEVLREACAHSVASAAAQVSRVGVVTVVERHSRPNRQL